MCGSTLEADVRAELLREPCGPVRVASGRVAIVTGEGLVAARREAAPWEGME